MPYPPPTRTSLFTLILALGPGATLAQTSASTVTPTASTLSSSPGSSAWYGLVTLTLLVVLVAVALRIYKRLGAPGPSEGSIQLLASKPLGPRESVVVVRLQDRIFVLGHTPSQVSLIAELDDFRPEAAPVAMAGGFAHVLTKALRKGDRR